MSMILLFYYLQHSHIYDIRLKYEFKICMLLITNMPFFYSAVNLNSIHHEPEVSPNFFFFTVLLGHGEVNFWASSELETTFDFFINLSEIE